jgi:hypothetical protein
VLGVGLGLGFGRAMSLLPSPSAAGVFWVGNLCAPWLALAFLTGRAQPSWSRAVMAGVLTEVACVTGFYAHFLFLGPSAQGLPEGTALAQYAAPALWGWLRFTAPWLAAATGAGAVYAALGQWWRRSRAAAGGVAVGLPFVAEPGMWTLRLQHVPWPVWTVEVLFGLAVTLVLLRPRPPVRQRRTPH